MATVHPSELKPATSPEGAVQSLLNRAKGRDFAGAYNYVSKSSNTDQQSFAKDLNGRDGSLRTYSSLQKFDTKVLHESDNDAMVRANVEWSTAVGAFYDTRDLKVIGKAIAGRWSGRSRSSKGAAAGHPGELPALGHRDPRIG